MKRRLDTFKRISCVLGILFIVLGVIPIPSVSMISEVSAASSKTSGLPGFSTVNLFESLAQTKADSTTTSLPGFSTVNLFDVLSQTEGEDSGETGDSGDSGDAGDSGDTGEGGETDTEDPVTDDPDTDDCSGDACDPLPEEEATEEPEEEATDEPEDETAPEPTEEPADDGEESEEEATEETPQDEASDETSEEEPEVDIAEIVADLAEADVVLTDETGEEIPLASNEAAEILSNPDPYFTRWGQKHCYVSSGSCDSSCNHCTVSSTPIQDAIDNVHDYGLPDGGTIYFEAGTYYENVIINVANLTLYGDPGDPNEAGAGPNAPILSGDFFGSNGIGFDIRAEGVSIVGFIIEHFDVAIKLNAHSGYGSSSSKNFTASNNTLHDNDIAIQSFNSISGVKVNYNSFYDNVYAIVNDDSGGCGGCGSQYLDARYNWWGCEDGPVVERVVMEQGDCIKYNWHWPYNCIEYEYNEVSYYYYYVAGTPPSEDDYIPGFNPCESDCQIIFGNHAEHWNHPAFNWTPYKIILGGEVSIEHFCGDGDVDPDEECDDGNNQDGDGCSANCTLEPYCGDGTVDAGEACDDGNDNNNDDCRNDCTIPVCGDGIVDSGESCDDGNDNNDDDCRNDCTIPVCGDGIVDAGEACDDGNDNNDDDCRNDCSLPYCGDGYRRFRVRPAMTAMTTMMMTAVTIVQFRSAVMVS